MASGADTHTHRHTHTHTHTYIRTEVILRNQARAGLRPARAWFNNEHHDYILSVLLKQAKAGSSWFLEIAFVWEVDMRVCLCVSAPELLKTIHVK